MPVRLGALSQLQDGLLGYFVDGDATRMHTPDPAVADFARPLGPDRGFLQRIDLVHGYSAAFADDLAGEATAGSSPVRHPFIDTSGVLWVQPERDVMLTLLMEPHSRLHVTTGMLPRKDIGMRRSWLDAGLSHLMPTFRFGPVLVDPQQVRMPVPRQVDGQWSWSHRAAIGRWENPAIVQATSDAGISDDPAIATEGWLRFEPPARATEEDR